LLQSTKNRHAAQMLAVRWEWGIICEGRERCARQLHRTLHDPLERGEHAGTAASANKLGTPKTETAMFIVDAADGYTTVNIMEAITTTTHQVTISKPTHAGIDTGMGDVVEIAKSWETHIPKKVSGDTKCAYVAVLKSAVGSLKIDKNRLKKLQESIGESMRV